MITQMVNVRLKYLITKSRLFQESLQCSEKAISLEVTVMYRILADALEDGSLELIISDEQYDMLKRMDSEGEKIGDVLKL